MDVARRIASGAGLASALAAVLALVPADARACSYAAPEAAVVDPSEAAVDTVPPGAIARPAVSVKRGHGLQREGCSGARGTDSCADMGTLHLEVDVAPDDRTAPESMGYRVEVVEGDDPGFLWPDLLAEGVYFHLPEAGRADLWIPWIDGDTNAQEPLDLVLRITPLDRAGNAGPPVDVEVHDPGSGGCGAGPAGPIGLLPVALVALVALRRRLSRRPR